MLYTVILRTVYTGCRLLSLANFSGFSVSWKQAKIRNRIRWLSYLVYNLKFNVVCMKMTSCILPNNVTGGVFCLVYDLRFGVV